MAFVPGSEPGIVIGFPFSSLSGFPFGFPPSLAGRPFSLTSKAIAFALRTEVVFRL